MKEILTVLFVFSVFQVAAQSTPADSVSLEEALQVLEKA